MALTVDLEQPENIDFTVYQGSTFHVILWPRELGTNGSLASHYLDLTGWTAEMDVRTSAGAITALSETTPSVAQRTHPTLGVLIWSIEILINATATAAWDVMSQPQLATRYDLELRRTSDGRVFKLAYGSILVKAETSRA